MGSATALAENFQVCVVLSAAHAWNLHRDLKTCRVSVWVRSPSLPGHGLALRWRPCPKLAGVTGKVPTQGRRSHSCARSRGTSARNATRRVSERRLRSLACKGLREPAYVDYHSPLSGPPHAGPEWASVNIGVFLCIKCAGVHRVLSVQRSRVRSVRLDTWTEDMVKASMALRPLQPVYPSWICSRCTMHGMGISSIDTLAH